MSSARREGNEYHFKSLWYDSAGARTHDLLVVRQMLYHWAITPVVANQSLLNAPKSGFMKVRHDSELPQVKSSIDKMNLRILQNVKVALEFHCAHV